MSKWALALSTRFERFTASKGRVVVVPDGTRLG